MRYIFSTGEKSDEWPAQLSDVLAHRPAQHGISSFELVEYRPPSHSGVDVEFYLAIDARQDAQMRRQNDANHGSVCTSTESTAGRSRTIGFQLSPALGDA
jgi:hypothetical protein